LAEQVEAKLDPARSTFILVVGRKGSGKSELAHLFFRQYPYDRLVIDPTHDVKLEESPEDKVTVIDDPLPVRFPSPVDGERITLHYKPDMGSLTVDDDTDRAVGLAFTHRRTLLWIDEIGEVARIHQTQPYMRRSLNYGRHRDLSLLMCGPRPINIDPLCVSQADYVYIFEMPNPRDRDRIAEGIGWDPKAFTAAVHELTGTHAYLRYNARAKEHEDRLVEFPPLPAKALSPR
jgi:hypothetical protein